MLLYVLRRLAIAIPTLLLVSVLVFGLLKLLPGDPAIALAGEERDPAVIEFLRQKYSLDQPLYIQYVNWLGGILHGDFGLSIRTRLPIGQMLVEKLPVTIELSILAMLIALVVGIPAGIIAALRRGTPVDYGVSVLGLTGLSVPSFWLGIMLILLFAVTLGWLPSGGYVGFFESPTENLKYLLMPSIVLGTAAAAIVMRHTRSSMLLVLKQDYVRTARAKGLKERIVVIRHVLRNGLIPVVTMSTLHLGELLSGAVLTEQVFGIPGFGKMVVDGVFSRDYAVVQAVVLCSAAMFLFMNLIADIAYVILSPEVARMSSVEAPLAVPAATGARKSALQRCLSHPSAVIGGTIVLIFVLIAIFAPWIAPSDPNASNWLAVRQAPSAAHWFGTDDLGRDILSRVIFGARASLLVGIVSVAIAIAIGVPLGLISGYFGGIVDVVISRCAEALLACPFLVLAIAFAAFLGASLQNAMIAIGISAMPIFVRLTRGQVMTVRTEDYIAAARLLGIPHRKIMLSYVLPNVLAPIVVQATITMATAVLAEASLAFLGLGQRPPAPSWGTMLDIARQFLTQAPWMAIWPGVAIIVLVMGFNLLGDGLNDALDPRQD